MHENVFTGDGTARINGLVEELRRVSEQVASTQKRVSSLATGTHDTHVYHGRNNPIMEEPMSSDGTDISANSWKTNEPMPEYVSA